MQKLISALLFLCLISCTVHTQSYDDVCVLINTSSPESIEIGTYFQTKHNIADEHVLRIAMPMTSIISLEQAADLLAVTNPILDSIDDINYIVTTMGCPSVVNIDNPSDDLNFHSLEYILKYGTLDPGASSSLDFEPGEFTHQEFDIFIVSRLEARSLQGTKDLIDRGGVNILNTDNPLVLEIFGNLDNPIIIDLFRSYFENWKSANATLLSIPIFLELDTLLHVPQPDIDYSGYFGYILNDLDASAGAEIINKTEGIAVVLNSEGVLDTSGINKISALDFTEQNCHGAIGVVDLYYVSSSRRLVDVFKTYYSTDSEYNLGESFLINSIVGSNVYVLYGDPKSTVSFLSNVDNFQDESLEISIYPNPANDFFTIEASNKLGEVTVEIYTIDGKKLIEKTVEDINADQIDTGDLPSGEYVVSLKSKSNVKNLIFIKK